MPKRDRLSRVLSKHKKNKVFKHYDVKHFTGKHYAIAALPVTSKKHVAGEYITLDGDIGSRIIIGITEDDPIFAVGEWTRDVFAK